MERGGHADFLRDLSGLRAGGVQGRDRLPIRIFDRLVTFSHVFTVLSLGENKKSVTAKSLST
jgi:hypothetical protein